MDMGSIAAAFSSLNAVAAITKGLVGLHTTAEVQAKAIELNQQIIEAQGALFAVNQAQTAQVERIRELEDQIAGMKNWDTEKQRYKLATPETGALVYALQRAMSNGEPPHYLCANCFKQGKPSILNDVPSRRNSHWNAWECPNCQSSAPTGYSGPCPAKYVEDIPTTR